MTRKSANVDGHREPEAVGDKEDNKDLPPTKRGFGWPRRWKKTSLSGIDQKPTTHTKGVISLSSKNAPIRPATTTLPTAMDNLPDIKASFGEAEISLNMAEQSDPKTLNQKPVTDEACRSTEPESPTQKTLQKSRRQEVEENFRAVAQTLQEAMSNTTPRLQIPNTTGLEDIDLVDNVEETAKQIQSTTRAFIKRLGELKEAEGKVTTFVSHWFKALFPCIQYGLKKAEVLQRYFMSLLTLR